MDKGIKKNKKAAPRKKPPVAKSTPKKTVSKSLSIDENKTALLIEGEPFVYLSAYELHKLHEHGHISQQELRDRLGFKGAAPKKSKDEAVFRTSKNIAIDSRVLPDASTEYLYSNGHRLIVPMIQVQVKSFADLPSNKMQAKSFFDLLSEKDSKPVETGTGIPEQDTEKVVDVTAEGFKPGPFDSEEEQDQWFASEEGKKYVAHRYSQTYGDTAMSEEDMDEFISQLKEEDQ